MHKFLGEGYTHEYLIVQILVNELYHLYVTAVSAWCSTEGTTHTSSDKSPQHLVQGRMCNMQYDLYRLVAVHNSG